MKNEPKPNAFTLRSKSDIARSLSIDAGKRKGGLAAYKTLKGQVVYGLNSDKNEKGKK